MTLNGYLSNDFAIMSPAKLFFQTCIEILDLPGDNATVTIEPVLLQKETVSYRNEGFQISEVFESIKEKFGNDLTTWPKLDGYKKLEGIISAIHVDDSDRNRGILTVKYEKISSDIEDPKSVMNTFLDIVMVLDEYVLGLVIYDI